MPGFISGTIVYTDAQAIAAAKTDSELLNHWTLLETLSPSAVASIDSSTLTAQDLYMVLLRLSGAYATESRLGMQLNGDTGNNYSATFADQTTLTQVLDNAILNLCSFDDTYPQMVGRILLPGKLGAVYVPISGHVSPSHYTYNRFLSGDYNASANITQFTFLAGVGTITGKIKIYGMNF